jgi:hypothetical protein
MQYKIFTEDVKLYACFQPAFVQNAEKLVTTPHLAQKARQNFALL